MIKNVQFKLVLIFFLIGIIIIGGLGITFLNSLNNTQDIETIRKSVTMIMGVSALIFTVIVIIIAIFLSKFVIYPINKLIEGAEIITEEENKKDKSQKKKTKDIGDFENVFGKMTVELKQKLSEVSTQKNQIETILLHMTDGIIAFNREGEIILINPAAKKLLSIPLDTV